MRADRRRLLRIFRGSLLNCSFRSESLHARAGAFILVLLWPLSDGIFYIQRTIVKNLTKTMEIIIDFFFIWKKSIIISIVLVKFLTVVR